MAIIHETVAELSKKIKRLNAKDAADRVKLALEYLQKCEINGIPVTIRAAAKRYGAPRSTVHDRYLGKKTRSEAQKDRQLLSLAQEEVLVEWIKTWGYFGIPMNALTIRAKAMVLAGKDVGKNWIYRFMNRHEGLKTVWANKLDVSRARALNPEVVADFYKKLIAELVENGIPEKNIFNADEKGIMCGGTDRVKVLVDRNQKTVSSITQVDKELTTVIECVCADGSSISPMMIFKGVLKMKEWFPENDLGMNAAIASSPEGWTDQELGVLWMKKVFEPETRKTCDPKAPQLLIIDGHNSHTHLPFLDYAQKHNIIVLCLPPHTTHHLQPCDVGVFGPLAKAWKAEVHLSFSQKIVITRANLVETYARARHTAFKRSTIKSAFKTTGIWPPNPNALPPAAYGPSKATTTGVVLPGITPLPSSRPKTSPIPNPPTDILSPPTSSSSSSSTLPVSPGPSASDASNSAAVEDTSGALSEDTHQTPSAAVLESERSETGQEEERETIEMRGNENGSSIGEAEMEVTGDHVPQESSSSMATTSSIDAILPPITFKVSSIPPLPPPYVDRDILWQGLLESRDLAISMAHWIEKHAARIQCYVDENENLRGQLYRKQNKPKRSFLKTKARVLTKPEFLLELRAEQEEKDQKKREAAEKAKKKALQNANKENGGGTAKKGKKGKKKSQPKPQNDEIDARENEGEQSEVGGDDNDWMPKEIVNVPARVNPRRITRALALAPVPQNTLFEMQEAGRGSLGEVVLVGEVSRLSARIRQTHGGASAAAPTNTVSNSSLPPEQTSSSAPITSATAPQPNASANTHARTRKRPGRPPRPVEEHEPITVEEEDAFFTLGRRLRSRPI